MTDIIERLRSADQFKDTTMIFAWCREAADTIERLRAENARLHERLEDNRVYDKDGQRQEVEAGSIPDGIEARDETIKILDANVDTLRAKVELLRGENETLRERLEAALQGYLDKGMIA